MTSAQEVLQKYGLIDGQSEKQMSARDVLSKYNITTEQFDEPKELSGFKKFTVRALPIATSIAGGLLGIPGAKLGIVAGGAVGAGTGRMWADTLEEKWGGQLRTGEEILDRAVKEGFIDALLTIGTFGAFKGAKVIGLDKAIMKGLKKAAKPVVQRVKIQQLLETIARNKKAIKSTFNSSSDKIMKSAKTLGQFKLHNLEKTSGKLTKEILKATDSMATETSKITGVATEVLNNKYSKILQNTEGVIDLKDIMQQIDNVPNLKILAEGKTPLAKLGSLIDNASSRLGSSLSPEDAATLRAAVKEGYPKEMIMGALGKGATEQVADIKVAHHIKQSLDNIISTIYQGSDNVAKNTLGRPLQAIRNQLVGQIDELTGGVYKSLSDDWFDLMNLKKLTDSKLGKIGAGRSAELRGNIYSTLSEFKEIAAKQGQNVLNVQEGKVGILLKDIDFLRRIGEGELADSMTKSLGQLASQSLDLTTHKNLISSLAKEIGGEVKAKNLKNIAKLDVLTGQERINLQTLLKRQKALETATEKRLSTLGLRKDMLKTAKLELSKGNRIAPVIAVQSTAWQLGNFIPVLKAPLSFTASMYAIYKFAPEVASLVLKSIEHVSRKAAGLGLTKLQRNALGQFLKAITTEITFQASEVN